MGSLRRGGKHSVANMVFAKISPVNAITRKQSNKILSLMMSRANPSQKWGVSITGGWLEGKWIRVEQVKPGSPAAVAGVKEGDSLVNIGEELVIFLETEEVEELLQRQSDNLDMKNMVTIVINKEKGVWARM